MKFQTVEVELEDRDHVKLWIAERQLGRRNLTDDQRSIISNDVREFRSAIERKERASKAREHGGKATTEQIKDRLQAKSAHKRSERLVAYDLIEDDREQGDIEELKKGLRKAPTRKSVAEESKLPERKIRLAQEIKKAAPEVSQMVRAGDISLVEGRKLAALAQKSSPAGRAASERGIYYTRRLTVLGDPDTLTA